MPLRDVTRKGTNLVVRRRDPELNTNGARYLEDPPSNISRDRGQMNALPPARHAISDKTRCQWMITHMDVKRYATAELVLEIVGLKEIAERLGVKPQTAAAWRHRGLLPPPDGTVSGAPAWRWEVIEDWARHTGRVGAVAEFAADSTPGWRVMDGARVQIRAGVVVLEVSKPFPQPLPDGRTEKRVRFRAAVDGQWYEVTYDRYMRGTGELSLEQVGRALLAAAAAIGAIVVIGEAAKGKQ